MFARLYKVLFNPSLANAMLPFYSLENKRKLKLFRGYKMGALARNV